MNSKPEISEVSPSGSTEAVQRNPAAATKKMDPELKARWVAALRSGEYEQGRHALYRDGRYCCLGVLHKVITGETPSSAWDDDCERPALAAPAIGMGFVNMNDFERLPFSEIADWIEENL